MAKGNARVPSQTRAIDAARQEHTLGRAIELLDWTIPHIEKFLAGEKVDNRHTEQNVRLLAGYLEDLGYTPDGAAIRQCIQTIIDNQDILSRMVVAEFARVKLPDRRSRKVVAELIGDAVPDPNTVKGQKILVSARLRTFEAQSEILRLARELKERLQCRKPTLPAGREWLTVSQAAKITGANKGVIGRAVDGGQLMGRGTGRERRICPADLSRWQLDRAERPLPEESDAKVQDQLRRLSG